MKRGYMLIVLAILFNCSVMAQQSSNINNYLLDTENPFSRGVSPDRALADLVAQIDHLLKYKLEYVHTVLQPHLLLTGYNSANVARVFGISGDGVTDNTMALQKALDYADAHSESLYFPAGVYLTGPLLVTHPIKIYGDGVGSIIRLKSNAPERTPLLFIMNSRLPGKRDIVIRDITLDGNTEGNTANKLNNILQIENSQGIYVSHVHFRGAPARNLHLVNDSLIYVSDCKLDTSGNSSVFAIVNVAIYFLNNTLTGWGTLSPSSIPAYACIAPNKGQFLYKNNFSNTTHSSEFCIEMFHKGTDDSVIIALNLFEHSEVEGGPPVNGGVGISGGFSNSIIYNNHFQNDNSHGGFRAGLELTCSNTLVIGNVMDNGSITITANSFLRNVCNNLFANNRVSFNSGVGATVLINSDGDPQDTIQALSIYENQFDYSGNATGSNLGMRFGQSSRMVIRNIFIAKNTIIGNGGGYGIYFENSTNWDVKNVTIQANQINKVPVGIQNHNDNLGLENFILKENVFNNVTTSYDVMNRKVID